MMRFEACTRAHLEEIARESGVALGERGASAFLSSPGIHAAIDTSRAWSGFWNDRLVGCAAIYPVWPGRASTWAMFVADMPRRAWPAITNKVLTELDAAHADGFRRIECAVRADFDPAIVWAVRLGFEPSSVEPLFGPDGATHVLFRRLRPAAGARQVAA